MFNKIIVLSLPRCGSSIVTNLISSAGYCNQISSDSKLLGPSSFNSDGYFEDTLITLLNDQLIRMVYGMDYSFIHTPSFNDFQLKSQLPLNNPLFNFDLTQDTIFTPNEYSNKIKEYSGCDWDVWGLTRMVDGEKWYKCYSKYKVDNYENIKETLNNLVDNINSFSQNLVIKDPRLALTIPFYNIQNCKVIYVKRNKQDSLSSMRKHYGINMFTKNYIPDTEYCSNHFNYKVKYQDFDYYYDTYTSIIENYIKDKDSLIVSYEDLLNKDESSIDSINNHIQGNIDINLLKTKK
jgi:hypothetical protein